jgi:ABC-type glycerol-3-phosphate transport system substrate-binding protein
LIGEKTDARFVPMTPAHDPDLRAALGDDVLDVMLIPAGPAGAATPLLHSQALYFPAGPFGPNVESEVQQAAVTYAAYLLSADTQRYLMTEADLVPVNRLVDMSSRPRIARFAAQASSAVPYPTPRGPSPVGRSARRVAP